MDAILGDHSFDSSKDEFSCSQDGIAYSENSEVSDYGSESSPSPDLIVLTPEDLVTMMKTELEKFCDVTNVSAQVDNQRHFITNFRLIANNH